MQKQIVCHCGKCEVKCNKHNKRATCADCKKRRKLGTVIEKSVIRHICDDCCTVYEKKLVELENKRVMESLRSPENEEVCYNPTLEESI